ncbi:Uncharacterized conserved protein YybS, DUF2232 family [Alkalithermobacter thermoalcaliphilus JW-YL-7 = DSM 7308]|uniref:Uncharacterized conserved protein YybS, DUF2232 family n=1 Tax=Alkalithermobacter thermoalcaliphilus JW-YL-7 = DSM 7308 TaxID=1121328 RepID=A0A150FT33_CLOPD|nr:Protein of unknown function DUF2232, membrane [[Clostridium] paradoxum JW-YL-7 = DSM 7308]SHL09390.1 Uncharacterized conserved protein YybS, DUF2232 family [[Clostridium] paradoxum JW-YL-7 = DSM 7308]
MNNKTNRQRLVESAIISVLGVIISLICTYVPFFNLFISFVGIVYIIITFRNGIKYGILSAFVSSFLLSLITDPMYAITLGLVFFLPGISIGYGLNKNKNPFYSISLGFITSILVIILYTKLASLIFGIDIVQTLIQTFKEAVEIQEKMMKDLNVDNTLDSLNIVDMISTVIPSMIVISSIAISFINYYVSIYFLKRIKGISKDFPTLKEFTLPGNISFGISIILLLTLISSTLEWIYYQTLVTNVTLIFFFMFLLQGIAVFSYIIDKKPKIFKSTIIVLSIFIAPVMLNAISLIGLADSVFNFRKIRR